MNPESEESKSEVNNGDFSQEDRYTPNSICKIANTHTVVTRRIELLSFDKTAMTQPLQRSLVFLRTTVFLSRLSHVASLVMEVPSKSIKKAELKAELKSGLKALLK